MIDDRDEESETAAPGGRREDTRQTVLEQVGGITGLVQSTIPVVTFAPVNALAGLRWAIIAALAAGVAILLWRLRRRDTLQPAISGFLGVLIAVAIAWRTGEAKGFFLYGIWVSLVYGSIFALSVVARRPLVGVLWVFVNGGGDLWRRIPAARRAYAVATLAWAFVFFARFAVQRWLYDNDEESWLAIARIAMGWPPAVIAFVVTVAMVRRADAAIAAARRAADVGDGARHRS